MTSLGDPPVPAAPPDVDESASAPESAPLKNSLRIITPGQQLPLRVVQWTETLRLGVPAIDAQHQEIFDVCGRLNEAYGGTPPDSGALKFLGGYVERHFADEEQLMIASGYEDREEHALEHGRYREALRGLLARAESEGAAMRRVAESVTNWLIFHIMQEDRALARHLRRSAPAP